MSNFVIRLEDGVGDVAYGRLTSTAGDLLPATLTRGEGEAWGTASQAPDGVAAPFRLPEVGRLYVWVNNQGRGFTANHSPLTLSSAFVKERTAQLTQSMKQYARRGVPVSAAQHHLEAAQSATEPLMQMSHLIRASEALVRAVALTRLQRLKGRPVFLWGVQVRSSQPDTSHLAPFNTLALPLGCKGDWIPLIQYAQQERKVLIGTELGAEALQTPEKHLQSCLMRYRGWVRYWQILDDAPTHLKSLGADHTTQLYALRRVLQTAREIDPLSVRLLGVEHSLYHRTSGLAFLQACVELELPFEGVHLTLYWHDGDLFYFDHLLEQYGEVGKPLYLTLKLPPETPHETFWREDAARWIDSFCWLAISKPFVVGVLFEERSEDPLYGDSHGVVRSLIQRGYNPQHYESLE